MSRYMNPPNENYFIGRLFYLSIRMFCAVVHIIDKYTQRRYNDSAVMQITSNGNPCLATRKESQ